MTDKLLPLAAMEKVLRKAGADRVAEDAQEALKVVLEDVGHKIAEKATRLANHAGRKTVKAADIKLAAREMG
ncbi:NFYB/HAP3 family transcription factor subunit [Candidatus Woesearchaeota archaeon]|nr:NFYB/HAP3 family transcription factor subunit [Candidatus Woesearchaeota archaeon]MBW3017179.1 NFYB/HAP3 family transcription factor subunit [Candidatus Woesearchaeota archaeon]